jgi:hypothetical protein
MYEEYDDTWIELCEELGIDWTEFVEKIGGYVSAEEAVEIVRDLSGEWEA